MNNNGEAAVASDQTEQVLSLVLDDEDGIIKQKEKIALGVGGHAVSSTAPKAASSGVINDVTKISVGTTINKDNAKKSVDPLRVVKDLELQQAKADNKSSTATGDVGAQATSPTGIAIRTPAIGVPPTSLRRNQAKSGETSLQNPGAVAVLGPGSSLLELDFGTDNIDVGVGVPQPPTTSGSFADERIARARLVQEEENGMVHHAEPVPEGRESLGLRKSKLSAEEAYAKRMSRILLIVAALMAVAFAVTLGVVLGTKGDERASSPTGMTNSTNGTAFDSAEEVVPSEDEMRAAILRTVALPNHTIDTILRDPTSPQALAYTWLLNDTMLDDYTDSKRVQRFALATFYHSLGGEEWFLNDGWMNYSDECDWFHRELVEISVNVWAYRRLATTNNNTNTTTLVCDDNGQYLYLVFTSNNMKGTIPPEVGLLRQLRLLDLSINEDVVGSIPTEIGYLRELRRFSVARNKHTGLIPTEIGLLTKLEGIYLEHNPVSGPIPSEIGNLGESLKTLSIHRGGCTGFVPTELYQLTNLEEYLIQNNLGITGGTLDGLGNMTSLKKFIVHDVPYQEKLPSEIGLLTDLVQINFWNTQMTGSIPREFWQLTNLYRMDIDDNFFTGTFPNEVGNLSNLHTAWMNGNEFTGPIPSDIWQHLGKLTLLKMNDNRLTGSIPTEIGLLNSSMEDLWLNSMALSGTIPGEIGNIKSLKNVFMHNTDLSGTIPEELAGLSNLEVITLSQTALTGSIPMGLCGAVKDMNLTCLSVLGVEEQICTEVEVTDFSCTNSYLCGCSCGACT